MRFELFDRASNRFELLIRRSPVGSAKSDLTGNNVAQTRDAYLKELIKVPGVDREKVHPLKHRNLEVGSHRQHPTIEGQPAQLTIEVVRWIVVERGNGECASIEREHGFNHVNCVLLGHRGANRLVPPCP